MGMLNWKYKNSIQSSVVCISEINRNHIANSGIIRYSVHDSGLFVA